MMTKTAIGILSIGLIGALVIGIRTIFLTPGSTITTPPENHSSPVFTTQSISSHNSAPEGIYVPFDPRYGLQGTQRSRGKSEQLKN